MICPECKAPMYKMCDVCGVFYDEPVFEVTDLSNYNIKHKRDYKKMDHFKEVLNQFQGREDKHIPQTVLEIVRSNLPEMLETVGDACGVNLTRIILRKSRLSKYTENSHSIWAKVSGRQPPYIKRLVEDKLTRHFRQIVWIYEPLKSSKRTSFLNYYYVLYKLLHLMKETELLPYIPMLRTKQRIREHDRVWYKICQELDWNFFPTT